MRDARHAGIALPRADPRASSRFQRLTAGIGSAELRLVLCCARTQVDAAMAARIRSLAHAQVDWKRVLELSSEHRVLPLVARTLSAIAHDALPPAAWEGLASRLRCHMGDNLRHCHELITIVRLLASFGISAIPFKGPVLAVAAYGDLGLRQFGDLDLLVKPADALAASVTLRAHGYGEAAPLLRILRAQHDRPTIRLLYPGAHENSYTSGTQVHIDLHWGLHPRYFLPPYGEQGIWSRMTTMDLAGHALPMMAAEDALMQLIIHASREGWNRYGMICDVAEFIARNPTIDWTLLLARARTIACRRMQLLGLALAFQHLDAEIPPLIRSALSRDRRVGPLADTVWDRLGSALSTPGRRLLTGMMWSVRIRDHWQDGLDLWPVLFRLVLTKTAEGPLPRSAGSLVFLMLLPLWILMRALARRAGAAGNHRRPSRRAAADRRGIGAGHGADRTPGRWDARRDAAKTSLPRDPPCAVPSSSPFC